MVCPVRLQCIGGDEIPQRASDKCRSVVGCSERQVAVGPCGGLRVGIAIQGDREGKCNDRADIITMVANVGNSRHKRSPGVGGERVAATRWRRARAEDFHRGRRAARSIPACEPDVVSTVGTDGEVAPRSSECRAKRPAIGHWIIDVHFVRGIRGNSAAAHDPHFHACSIVERKRTGFSRSPWYVSNGADGISYWVIHKGIVRIDNRAIQKIAATAGVDAVTDSGGRYIAAHLRQNSGFHHPATGRSKLPNRVNHPDVNVEPTQNVKLVIEN